jgi:hypothetical protein
MATKAYLDVAGKVMRRHRLWLGFLAVAVILAAATAWTYGRLDRYQPDGRSWLPGPPFAGWEVEGRTEGIVIDGTTVRVINADPDGGTGLRWLLHRAAGDAAAFEVSATVWTEGLSGGRPRWHGGRVTIAEIGQGKRAGDPSRGRNIELANLQRDKVPAVYRKLFTFGSDTPRVELAIRPTMPPGRSGSAISSSPATRSGRPSALPPTRSAWRGRCCSLPGSFWSCATSKAAGRAWHWPHWP